MTAGGAATSVWPWARALGGLAILAVLVWQVGTGPFLTGIRAIDAPAAGAALGIGAVTTVCCAWRWCLVAAGFGVRLPLRDAVVAYYQAMFLNTTLPGGILGDVHRAVRHGSGLGDVGLGVRAVVVERLAGLAVLLGVGTVALSVFPSPVRAHLPAVGIAAVVIGLAVFGLARVLGRLGPARVVRPHGGARIGWRRWFGIVSVSGVAAAGHLATFLLAARTAGSTTPLTRLIPLTTLALLAMALPLAFAGWGPREGVAAWAFAAAGLTAAQGVATAVTYGMLMFVVSLPGAVVLLVRWLRPAPPRIGAPALEPALDGGRG